MPLVEIHFQCSTSICVMHSKSQPFLNLLGSLQTFGLPLFNELEKRAQINLDSWNSNTSLASFNQTQALTHYVFSLLSFRLQPGLVVGDLIRNRIHGWYKASCVFLTIHFTNKMIRDKEGGFYLKLFLITHPQNVVLAK